MGLAYWKAQVLTNYVHQNLGKPGYEKGLVDLEVRLCHVSDREDKGMRALARKPDDYGEAIQGEEDRLLL